MKKIIILFTNLLLVSLVLFTTVSGEGSGDATGNAWLEDYGEITVSADLNEDDLLEYAKDPNGVTPTSVIYHVDVTQPTVTDTDVTWNISLFLEGRNADNEYLSFNKMTEKLNGTITIELGLPNGYLDNIPALEEGATRTWKFVAKHEDGTTSEYEANWMKTQVWFLR